MDQVACISVRPQDTRLYRATWTRASRFSAPHTFQLGRQRRRLSRAPRRPARPPRPSHGAHSPRGAWAHRNRRGGGRDAPLPDTRPTWAWAPRVPRRARLCPRCVRARGGGPARSRAFVNCVRPGCFPLAAPGTGPARGGPGPPPAPRVAAGLSAAPPGRAGASLAFPLSRLLARSRRPQNTGQCHPVGMLTPGSLTICVSVALPKAPDVRAGLRFHSQGPLPGPLGSYPALPRAQSQTNLPVFLHPSLLSCDRKLYVHSLPAVK